MSVILLCPIWKENIDSPHLNTVVRLESWPGSCVIAFSLDHRHIDFAGSYRASELYSRTEGNVSYRANSSYAI